LNPDRLSKSRTVFKKCPICRFKWDSRDGFLRDPNINIIGYQVHFKELTAGLLLFNHSCRGTLAIQVADFKELYDGPIFDARATGGEECPGYCLRQDELRSCPAKCECAYVREIMSLIKHWTKD